MKYAEKLKNIWKIAATEETRYILSCIQIDAEKKVAVATDGICLAVIDVTDLLETEEKSFLIPAQAIKAAHQLLVTERARFRSKADKKNARPVFIRAIEDSVTVFVGESKRGVSFDRPGGQFPQWQAIANGTMDGYNLAIELDPSLLLKLSDALRNGNFIRSMGVSLYVKDGASPIIVCVECESKTFGLLMRMRNVIAKPTQFWIPKVQ